MTVAADVQFPEAFTVCLMTVQPGGPQRFALQHPYVELLWLPVIGPSATWAMRRLGAWALSQPDGLTVTLADLSGTLGLGYGSGPSSSVQRTLRRLVQFRLADWTDVLQVVPTVPTISDRQLARLSPALVRAHRQITEPSCHPSAPAVRLCP